MSSLYRRNKIYWLSFRYNNRSYNISLKTKDRSTANYLKAQKDKELIEGRYEIPTQNAECIPVLNIYMAFYERRRTPSVNSAVRSRIEKFLTWSQAVRIKQITETNFQEYLNKRLEKVSIYEANNIIIAIKGWLNWCVKSKIIATNPIENIKKFKTPETSRRFLTKEQIKEVLKSAANPDVYCDGKPTLLPFVATAIYAGLRKGELLALEWPDIDFKHNILLVRNKKDFTTKSKKNRTIELHPKLKIILWKHRKDSGKCFNTTNYRRIFGRIAKKAKIPNLKLHELRHTFITQALLAGVDIPTVSEWAGHSSWVTTKIYTHIHSPHKQEQIRRLNF